MYVFEPTHVLLAHILDRGPGQKGVCVCVQAFSASFYTCHLICSGGFFWRPAFVVSGLDTIKTTKFTGYRNESWRVVFRLGARYTALDTIQTTF